MPTLRPPKALSFGHPEKILVEYARVLKEAALLHGVDAPCGLPRRLAQRAALPPDRKKVDLAVLDLKVDDLVDLEDPCRALAPATSRQSSRPGARWIGMSSSSSTMPRPFLALLGICFFRCLVWFYQIEVSALYMGPLLRLFLV